MNKLKRKDINFRQFFKEQELYLAVIKNLQYNLCLVTNVRFKSLDDIKNLNNYKSKTKINHKCLNTLSKKIMNKKFKFARMELFRQIRSGKITGLKKSVW